MCQLVFDLLKHYHEQLNRVTAQRKKTQEELERTMHELMQLRVPREFQLESLD